jgi:prophage regulatory protein
MSDLESDEAGLARPPCRLIRLKEVQHRVGLSRSTIYKWMSEGRFPKSRSIGPKCAVWIEAEIDYWVVSLSNL